VTLAVTIIIIIIIIIIVIIKVKVKIIFNEGTQLAMAVFRGPLKKPVFRCFISRERIGVVNMAICNPIILEHEPPSLRKGWSYTLTLLSEPIADAYTSAHSKSFRFRTLEG